MSKGAKAKENLPLPTVRNIQKVQTYLVQRSLEEENFSSAFASSLCRQSFLGWIFIYLFSPRQPQSAMVCPGLPSVNITIRVFIESVLNKPVYRARFHCISLMTRRLTVRAVKIVLLFCVARLQPAVSVRSFVRAVAIGKERQKSASGSAYEEEQTENKFLSFSRPSPGASPPAS